MGRYVEDPTGPAGDGWCEVIVSRPVGSPERYCYTQAIVGDDGRRVCNLHPDRTTVRLGPIAGPVLRTEPIVGDNGEVVGERLDHDGPCRFVDGACPCGRLDLGLG